MYIISDQPYTFTIGSNNNVKITELNDHDHSFNGKIKRDHHYIKCLFKLTSFWGVFCIIYFLIQLYLDKIHKVVKLHKTSIVKTLRYFFIVNIKYLINSNLQTPFMYNYVNLITIWNIVPGAFEN